MRKAIKTDKLRGFAYFGFASISVHHLQKMVNLYVKHRRVMPAHSHGKFFGAVRAGFKRADHHLIKALFFQDIQQSKCCAAL